MKRLLTRYTKSLLYLCFTDTVFSDIRYLWEGKTKILKYIERHYFLPLKRVGYVLNSGTICEPSVFWKQAVYNKLDGWKIRGKSYHTGFFLVECLGIHSSTRWCPLTYKIIFLKFKMTQISISYKFYVFSH